jgi:hypothetical protein
MAAKKKVRAAKRNTAKKAARKRVTRRPVQSERSSKKRVAKKTTRLSERYVDRDTGEEVKTRKLGKIRRFVGPAKKKTAVRRRNSSAISRAKSLVKKFIGRATGKVVKAKHPGLKKGTVLAKLTHLDYLKLRNRHIEGGMVSWKQHERPVLASKASGKQFFFVGGNQNLDAVPPVRVANPAGVVDLGEVLQLGYTATKHVNGFKRQGYYHKLGEENGKRPHLLYDRRTKQMHFHGGDYRTEAEGVAN